MRWCVWCVVAAAVVVVPCWAEAQMGLKTAPLTAPRLRDPHRGNDSLGVFTKWEPRKTKNATSRIESSLAAIFRGVAYGVSTVPTTSTSTTTLPPTLTSPSPTTRRGRHGTGHAPSTMVPGVVTDGGGAGRGGNVVGHSPVQTPYVEADPDPPAPGEDDDDVDDAGVVRAGVGVAWVRGLGVAWLVHVYVSAGLYSILALLALFWLSRAHASAHVLPRGHYITVLLLMFLAGFLRCIYLFHDPYGAQHRLPESLTRLLDDAGWPCLTAGVAVAVVAMAAAWGCPRHASHHAPMGLAVLALTHLAITVSTHVTAAALPHHAPALTAAARTVTAAWGGLVGVGGVVVVWRAVRGGLRASPHLLVRLSRTTTETLRPPRSSLLRGAHLTLAAALAQVCTAALHVYALVGPAAVVSVPPTSPWQWLAYHTGCRGLEVLAWLLLLWLALLPGATAQHKRDAHKPAARHVAALWCRRCCHPCIEDGEAAAGKDDEAFPAVCRDAVSSYTLDAGGKEVYQESLAPPNYHPPAPHQAATTRPYHPRQSLPRKSATLMWSHPGHTSTITTAAPPPAPLLTAPSSSRPSSALFTDAGLVRFRVCVGEDEEVGGHEDVRPDTPRDSVSAKLLGGEGGSAQSPSYEPPLYHLSRSAGNSPVKAPGRPFPGRPAQRIANTPYSDGSDGESITDCSSTDALTPQVMSEADWSKYASTCSSVSAANSFDVRMFDDVEGMHHRATSGDGAHVYATLHRPSGRAVRLARLHTSYAAPPRASDPDLCLGHRHPHPDTSPALARRLNPSHSPVPAPSPSPAPRRAPMPTYVMDYRRGQRPDGEEGPVLVYIGQNQEERQERPGLLTKIVMNNFSMNSGYTPLSSDELYSLPYQQQQEQQQQQPTLDQGRTQSRREKRDRVRPCGHRPRRGPQTPGQDPLSPVHYPPIHSSPVHLPPIHSSPVHQSHNPTSPVHLPPNHSSPVHQSHNPTSPVHLSQNPLLPIHLSHNLPSPIHLNHNFPSPVHLNHSPPVRRHSHNHEESGLAARQDHSTHPGDWRGDWDRCRQGDRWEEPDTCYPPYPQPASPSSSMPASSNASHTDLQSECVDSEDDLQSDAAQKHDSDDDVSDCPTVAVDGSPLRQAQPRYHV